MNDRKRTMTRVLVLVLVALVFTNGAKGGCESSAGRKPGESGHNRAYAKRVLARYGWSSSWPCLNRLWINESGWRHEADNPVSSAYGIPQALTQLHDLPAGYYGSGWGSGSNWDGRGGNRFVQIRWGVRYIDKRYGGPCAALRAWQSRDPHWY